MTAAWKSWPIPAGDVDMYEWQDGRCAWCGVNGARVYGRRMARDHCHDTGLVRGYLCAGCNRAEGVASGGGWEEWREGDTPAQAFGHFEVYVNHLGGTPLSPHSALNYYTHAERLAWWAEVEASVAAGGRLPSTAPWTDFATERREAGRESVRQALDGVFARIFSDGLP